MDRNQAIRNGLLVNFADSLFGYTGPASDYLIAADDHREMLLADQGRLTAKDRKHIARYELEAADCYRLAAAYADKCNRPESAAAMRKRESEIRAQAEATLNPVTVKRAS